MTVERHNPKTNTFHISTAQRPHYASVNQVCSEQGFIRFGIDAHRVDQLVGKIMICLQDFTADEVITAVGIVMVLILQRFQFTLNSYFTFIENFLRADDIKTNCHGLQRFLATLYTDHVARPEKVDFRTKTVKF